MDIAILVKEFPPAVVGGTEVQTRRMARELSRRDKHDVTVYTKSYPEEVAKEEFKIVSIPNWRLNPFVSTLTFVLLSIPYLLWNSRKHDVLQCMMVYPTGFVGYLIARLAGLPYFAWIRGGDYYFMIGNLIKRWMIGQVLKGTLVLVQTEQIRQDILETFPNANLKVLGNGVYIPDRTADGEGVLFVGRLKDQKGVDVLIRALEGTDARLCVIGDGPEQPRLESLARHLDVRAEFVGEIHPGEVVEHMVESRLLVLPSVRGEGLPNVLLEAQAVGLPVVATDTGGVSDAVVDGETGFVVEPGDEEALRNRIERLRRNDSLHAWMAENARHNAEERYSWSRIVAELDRVYRERIGAA